MQVQRVSNQNIYPQNFGIKFKLSTETIKAIENSTKLTYEEMTTLPLSETEKLMIKRGSLKKPSKFKTWISEKYRELGEKFGLIEKQHNIYTDID